MRVEVLPAVNCSDQPCVEEKLRVARPFSKWIHLDVTDGRFTFNRTWGDPALWPKIGAGFSLEVHLMVEDPDHVAGAWLRAGAKRLIVHAEAVTKQTLLPLLQEATWHGAIVMLSTNPDTGAEAYRPYRALFTEFQVLAVHPGRAGQRFIPEVLDKIHFLRDEVPGAIIEVDGGVTEETGKRAVEAGALRLVSASYIFDAADPRAAYEALLKIQ
jgi:ribulose-phosphate 3-epimerase